MRSRLVRSSSLVLVAALALGGGLGCSTTSGPGGRMTAAAADVLVPVEQENQLGQQMAAELQAELKLHPDPELQAYVTNIGNRIVAAAQADVPAGISFRFHVVQDDATVNAFAIPGGDIYVYTGLMRLAENEAELAGVLGHEVAHVTNRHIAQRLVAQYGLQSIIAMALGQDAGLLSQIASSVAGQGFLLKYGRDHERESDHDGIAYAAAAGWSPQGFVTFFEKMERLSGGSSTPTILVTHPPAAERLESAQKRIAELGPVPDDLGAERYAPVLRRLGGPAAGAGTK